MGVGFRPNPNEQAAGARPQVIHSLSTGQSYPQVIHSFEPELSTGYTPDIHSLSTGQNRCVCATLKKDLVDTRVYSIVVESLSVITVYSTVEQSIA